VRTRQMKALRSSIRSLILPLAHADRATRLALNVDP
jgi:hypothetical protein